MFRKQKESQKCRLEVYIKEQMVHFIWNLQEGLLCRIYVKPGGSGISQSFSVDTEEGKMTYRVDFKADRAVKKIQIIEMNKDDVKIKKTAYISPEIKQYQMQKDTAYVIINEQLIGMKGQTINRQKIHSAKKNFTYKWKQLGDDGVLTPTDLKFKK